MSQSQQNTAAEEFVIREKHFRLLYEQAPVPYQSLDATGHLLEVNQAWLELLGYAADEVRGRAFEELITPAGVEAFHQGCQSLAAKGRVAGVEFELRRKDKSVVAVSVTARAARDEQGTFTQTQCILCDITERKQRESEIERMNRLYAVLSQVNQAVVRSRSRAEVFDRVCRAAVAYGGFRAAWIGWLDPETRAVHPVAQHGELGEVLRRLGVSADDSPEGRGPTGTAIREGRTVLVNDLVTNPVAAPWHALAAQHGVGAAAAFPVRIGEVVHGALVLYAAEPGFFRDREVRLLEEAASDISFALAVLENEAQRRQAEEQIAMLKHSIDSHFDGAYWVDSDNRFVYVNYAGCTALGYTRDELMGRNIDVVNPGASAEAMAEVWEKLRQNRFFAGEAIHRRKDGSEFPVEIVATYGCFGGREYNFGFARDITERKRAEESLRAQSALLEATLDATPNGILVVDGQGRKMVQNQRMAELWKIPKVIADDRDDNKQFQFVTSRAKQPDRFRERAAYLNDHPGETSHEEFELVDGTVLDRYTAPVTGKDGTHYGRIWSFRDITENKRITAQYLRAQRLESVGTLASGVAHDLNNILSPVLMGIGLLQADPALGPHGSILAMMEGSARRGADTVKQLLTFARGAESQKCLVQPRHLVKEIGQLIRQTFPKNIQISIDAPAKPWTVRADPSQLHQVLMNLCVNARDAMPEGGILRLTTVHCCLDESAIDLHPKAKPGPYIVIKVSDNGIGIAPEVAERIFEPFFTTKPQGKGTGLGLATVLGIAEGHGGFVLAESQVGHGATFSVYFPACECHETEYSPAAPGGAHKAHGEWILVVDDEPAIVGVAEQLLRQHGFTVLAASTAVEALEMFIPNRERIRIVLTDLMMPFGDGGSLIRRLRELEPRIGIVAMSGLAAHRTKTEILEQGANAFVAKPFAFEDLLATLEQVLN